MVFDCDSNCFVAFIGTVLQTPFVRQNTPHPRELKAKYTKFAGKGNSHGNSSFEDSDHHPDGTVNPISNDLGEQLVIVCVYFINYLIV